MILYMVNINNKIKAKVISFPNEYRRDVFTPYLINLGKKAQENHHERVQLTFLLKALDLMQYVDFVDFPDEQNQFYQELEITVDGETYSQSFELIKPLAKENIYELRINLTQYNWRFRGIFFPYNYNGQQFYCFIYPFIK